MADIVLAIGTSHSPMLASPPEDYPKHAEIDAKGRRLLDKNGRPCTYGELLAAADPGIAALMTPEALEERAGRCIAAVAHLGAAIAKARLDALIVVGDDQNEQFFDDNMPSILVYWGKTIENRELNMPADAPGFWRTARSMYHETVGTRLYPVDDKLALHLIEHLIGREFDISHAKRLSKEHGEGHAFGFVHRRLMGESVVPIVPVALNTYFPPNQPRPGRCWRLGQEIRAAVESFPGKARVGVLASGGLSHFTVDEDFDRAFIAAMKARDGTWLSSIPVEKLNSGNSEMRNWIATAAAAEKLELSWHQYVPVYRSLAGTGCGMGFAIWS